MKKLLSLILASLMLLASLFFAVSCGDDKKSGETEAATSAQTDGTDGKVKAGDNTASFEGTWTGSVTEQVDNNGTVIDVTYNVTLVIGSDNTGKISYENNYGAAQSVDCTVNGNTISYSNGASGSISLKSDSSLTLTLPHGEDMDLTRN